MSKYICKEKVIEHLDKCRLDPLFDPDMARMCFAISIFIENMEASDVQPVKRGKWLHFNNENFIFCSECKREAYRDSDDNQHLFDYCPYCGAKMIKDGDTNG